MPADKKKPRPTSVQIPSDLDKDLADAMELTGMSRSSLLVACGRKAIRDVVAEVMRDRAKKASKFIGG
jgi:hypothetical protein